MHVRSGQMKILCLRCFLSPAPVHILKPCPKGDGVSRGPEGWSSLRKCHVCPYKGGTWKVGHLLSLQKYTEKVPPGVQIGGLPRLWVHWHLDLGLCSLYTVIENKYLTFINYSMNAVLL